MSVNQVKKWLDEKVFTGYGYINPYYSKYSINKYYEKGDDDIKMNDRWSRQLTSSLDSMNSVDIYMEYPELLRKRVYNDHILLDPGTNRYHANMLFRQLVDYTISNDLNNLINIDMKESFYNFCYEMS